MRNKTIINFIWRFLERCGSQGVTFVVSIILARLLSPSDYGTIALVTVIINVLQVFVDSGMGNALIQKKNADDTDFSTVFYFNLGISLTLYGIVYLCAPLIALFYEKPELTPIVRVLCLVIPISGVKNIQQAYISRNMMFHKFFVATLSGSLVSAAVGIGMAYAGCGIWSIVGQQLVNAAVGTACLWVAVKWRPRLLFSLKRLMGMLSFGCKLLFSALIDTVYNNMQQLIIGKIYSSSDLAYYNKGNQFPYMIVTNVNSSIDSVMLPTLSREQDDKVRVKAMTQRAIRMSTYVMAPMLIGLAACAKPLVELLLTDKWIDSVFYIRAFCIVYMFYPIHTANLNAIKALGRSDLFLKLEIIKKALGFAALMATMFISVEAMAISSLVMTPIGMIVNASPNKKLLDYSWGEQMKDILPNLVLAAVMGIAVYLMQFIPLPALAVLILQVITGAVIYVVGSAVFKMEMFCYLLDILKSSIRKKNK